MIQFRFDNTIWKNTSMIVLLVCLLSLSPALAQTGGGYDLTWSMICGGGGTSTGGLYMLTGTIGQPNVGSASGGIYELLGGFWPDVSGSTGMYHPADTDSNYVISMLEILGYIDQWAVGDVSMLEVLEGIDLWAAGQYYWDESEQKFKPGAEP